MAAPTTCPKCKNTWGIVLVKEARKPDTNVNTNDKGSDARFKCDACYHNWEYQEPNKK